MKIPMDGHVSPGFEPVRVAFEESFTRRGELGAACTIYHEGTKVVDLWGGYTTERRDRPWAHDTLVLCYSLSKGVSALASALAVSRGLFSYSDRVSTIWPAFGCNGKERITVRQLLSEQAGLCVIDTRLDAKKQMDPRALGAILAAQAPSWPPGEWAGNHADTIGWLHSELISHTDARSRTLGRYFREEIAQPLGLDFYFGLPEEAFPRMARIKGWPILALWLHLDTLPFRLVLDMMLPWTLTFKTFGNPLVFNPADLDVPAYWRGENGGAGGIGDARSLARLYSEFATGGGTLGISDEVLTALRADAAMPARGWMDQVFQSKLHYSLGLEKPSDEFPFGSGPGSFGTFAMGGSMAFADPDRRVGYAYTTNKLGFYKWNDPREMAVRDAFYRVIE
jgi:CubicO group peptidase (beta-lactamase class C family)